MTNKTNTIWQEKLVECLHKYDYTSKPRGMEVSEIISGHYKVPMPAYLNLSSRGVNVPFMFAEAAWIISGSNRLSDIKPFMKGYAKFSDDQVFLRGAYGPKVVDQLGYVVDAIEKDNDTRQAVINIWRERPGQSKDIPCTISMQFLLRNKMLQAVVTMRSQDIVLGFTYDVFTFSMVANAVRLLLAERGIDCELGSLYVNAGSMHLYKQHYDKARNEFMLVNEDHLVSDEIATIMMQATTYEKLIAALEYKAVNHG